MEQGLSRGEKKGNRLHPKIPPGTPVPKPPTTKGGVRRVLKKFGVPGAVITGVLGVAGNKAIRDNKKMKSSS